MDSFIAGVTKMDPFIAKITETVLSMVRADLLMYS